MQRTLFISDLHLDSARPAIIAALAAFLKDNTDADALYILGDLFEVWVGDDDDSPLAEEVTTLFQEFTLLENVLVGCHLHMQPKLLSSILRTDRAKRKEAHDQAMEALEFFDLADRKNDLASELPHGLQRALGMAVALAAEPKVLLLDEPFTGMNPEETRHMMDLMWRIQEKGVTLLLVEHDMQAVMGLCNYITVLNFGRLLVEGTPEEIRNNPSVIEAYLGAAHDAA